MNDIEKRTMNFQPEILLTILKKRSGPNDGYRRFVKMYLKMCNSEHLFSIEALHPVA